MVHECFFGGLHPETSLGVRWLLHEWKRSASAEKKRRKDFHMLTTFMTASFGLTRPFYLIALALTMLAFHLDR